MKYRTLGKSGLKVSEIGLGNWLTAGSHLDKKSAKECVHTAIDCGINFLDTADVYTGAEEVLGDILLDLDRQKLIIGTKCFFPTSENPGDRGLSRRHVLKSVESSLRKLKVDTIDLMQCHRFDPETPLEETVVAMGDLVRQGKILYWGISRWNASQTQDAIQIAQSQSFALPISNQYFYNMLNRDIEAELLDASLKMGVGVLAYSPLAQGILTGKYQTAKIPDDSRAANPTLRKTMWDFTLKNLQIVEKLRELAESQNWSMPQMALAWCLRKPNVASVLIGATRPQQILENITAIEKPLSENLLVEIERILAA